MRPMFSTTNSSQVDLVSGLRRSPGRVGQGRSVWKFLRTRTPATASLTVRVALTIAMVGGAALIGVSGLIHLHLWAAGYRNIPTIGPLFLAQAIVALLVSIVLVATRRLGSALLGAGFLASTAGGLFVSDTVGLFGFHDGFNAPWAGASLLVEGIGIAVLTVAGLAMARSARSNRPRDSLTLDR
jgi:hypothetical protein